MDSIKGVIPLLLALIAVGAILYLSYLFSRYLAVGAAKINKSKHIKIVDRAVLGQDRMLLIARIGEKYYLIGSSAQSLNILTELDGKDLTETSFQEKIQDDGSFKSILKRFQR